MPADDRPPGEALARALAKVAALEERHTFLERDVEQLSAVVAGHAAVLERLQGELQVLRAALRPQGEGGQERTLEDDRPPHY